MNTIKLIGRLTQEPEVRYTQTGKAVTSFTIAVPRSFAAGQEQREASDFIPVVVWGNLAELCGKTLNKGHRVLVEGRMQVRTYEAKDGQKRRITEVIADFIAQSIQSDTASHNQVVEAACADNGQAVAEKIPF